MYEIFDKNNDFRELKFITIMKHSFVNLFKI